MPTPDPGWSSGVSWQDEHSFDSSRGPDRGRSGAGTSTRVVVFDPGDRRTGIATATVAPGRLTKVKGFVMPLKEVALWLAEQQHVMGLYAPSDGGELCYGKPTFDVIVYETWRPRPVNGDMNWIQGNPLLSAQLVGMIRLIGFLSGALLRGQGPDVKKAAFAQIESGMPGTAILKRRIHSSTEQHDKDALAHLWRYYCDHWRV